MVSLRQNQLQKINLSCCRLTRVDTRRVAHALSSMYTVSVLILFSNMKHVLGGSGDSWSHSAKIKHKKKVTVRSCNLTGGDIPYITGAQSNLPHLAGLNVSYNKTLARSPGKRSPLKLNRFSDLIWVAAC